MIVLRDLQNQVGGLRSDILPAQVLAALEEASIKLARDTNLLTGTTLATLPTGKASLLIPVPPTRKVCRVELVEFQDPSIDGQWRRVGESARIYQDGKTLAPDTAPLGRSPAAWALQSSTLTFPDPADQVYPVRIKYAWAPVRFSNPASLPFPDDAEDALAAYAGYLILRISGKEKDVNMAFASMKQYNLALPNLRAMADTGESGNRSVFDFLPKE